MTQQIVASTADLEPEEAKLVELQDANGTTVPVALVRDADGDFHAISDICSHGAVSLSDGEVEGCRVECWLHGSQFDLRTGKPLQLPATRPVPVYPVTVEGDKVLVDIDEPVAAAS
ncbi:non-heme iron oxygenase ferredoxin subunit [Isoptericola halotolerans]|uniref:non-heme iron oxygenase ferredoxin subunit n=1 Tax=Isoptericola halotolerans TaxID=300560 RepID=UPI00388E72E5